MQSINDTNSSSDRQALNNEVSQLIAEINRIANSTQFNGQNILDGTLSTLTFQVGANQGQTIQVTGVDSRTSQLGARISTSSSFTSAAIAAFGTIVVNGNSVDLSAATTTEDVVSAINAVSASSGVQALKATSTSTAVAGLAITTTGTVLINSVAVNVTNGDATATRDAINAVSTQTGVTATIAGANIVLANSDGSNIVVDNSGSGQLGTVAGAAETFQAGVILAGKVSEGAFTVTGGGNDVDGVALGAAAQTDNTLTGVDVLTGANANDALLTLDFALQQVSGLRAELGAVQTRFESTISNLAVTSENLSAARSRIRDADFAAETAELTRSQILQQAGIAILAQANAQPQNVLALLQ